MSDSEESVEVVTAATEPEPVPEAPAGPEWRTINEGLMDRTDLMAVPGGYLVRSVWQSGGRFLMNGAAMVFVPGDVPEGFAR